MKGTWHLLRRRSLTWGLTALLLMCAGCGTRQAATENMNRQLVESAPAATPAAEPQPERVDPSLLERVRRERWTGDLDGMVGRRFIRALVTYNRSYYFYDGAEPRGISYEALKGFEQFLNEKLGRGNLRVSVLFIPVPRGELLHALAEGRGDIAASNIAITNEGRELVDYSDPTREGASSIIVTGPSAPPLSSLEDLGGKEVFVRRRRQPLLGLPDEA